MSLFELDLIDVEGLKITADRLYRCNRSQSKLRIFRRLLIARIRYFRECGLEIYGVEPRSGLERKAAE
jgi:hypothetical protein